MKLQCTKTPLVAEEELQVLGAELGHLRKLAVRNAVEHQLLLLLQRQHCKHRAGISESHNDSRVRGPRPGAMGLTVGLDRTLGAEADGLNGSGLADAVGALDRLHLNRRVPLQTNAGHAPA